jgi:hypothetical protein
LIPVNTAAPTGGEGGRCRPHNLLRRNIVSKRDSVIFAGLFGALCIGSLAMLFVETHFDASLGEMLVLMFSLINFGVCIWFFIFGEED